MRLFPDTNRPWHGFDLTESSEQIWASLHGYYTSRCPRVARGLEQVIISPSTMQALYDNLGPAQRCTTFSDENPTVLLTLANTKITFVAT